MRVKETNKRSIRTELNRKQTAEGILYRRCIRTNCTWVWIEPNQAADVHVDYIIYVSFSEEGFPPGSRVFLPFPPRHARAMPFSSDNQTTSRHRTPPGMLWCRWQNVKCCVAATLPESGVKKATENLVGMKIDCIWKGQEMETYPTYL